MEISHAKKCVPYIGCSMITTYVSEANDMDDQHISLAD